MALLFGSSSSPRVAPNCTVLMASPPAFADAEISLLEGLEESRTIHYSRLQAFSAALRQLRNAVYDGRTTNQYLVVKDVDENTMDHIEARRYKGVRYEWHGDLELLIVKVPTEAHESAAVEFGSVCHEAAGLMGVARIERRLVGTATFRAAAGTPRKQPDWSMKPANIRPPGHFPTMVIEVGFSESLRKLRNDARLWFSMSNNDVQIVILIAVRAANNQIIIEKWALGAFPAGQRTTRHTPAQIPQAEQSVTITRTSTSPNVFAITAGAAPIILEFHRLFLRQPVGQEQNIAYTQAELFDIAEAIFS